MTKPLAVHSIPTNSTRSSTLYGHQFWRIIHNTVHYESLVKLSHLKSEKLDCPSLILGVQFFIYKNLRSQMSRYHSVASFFWKFLKIFEVVAHISANGLGWSETGMKHVSVPQNMISYAHRSQWVSCTLM